MSGNGAEEALRLYAASDFCLQPPGDTLPRPGIIDATPTPCPVWGLLVKSEVC